MYEDITTSADFNNFMKPGTYRVASSTIASNISNIPEAKAGTLYVHPHVSGTSVLQVYVTNAATFTDEVSVYYRVFKGAAGYKWWKVTAVQQA